MGKIIITEQQFKLLLGEEMVSDTEDVKGQALYHISGLPTDKRETPGAIRTLLSSILETGDSYPVGASIDLTTLSPRNKMRFSGYWDAFHGAKGDNRGHMWEGLFSGLYGGELTSGKESDAIAPKADVTVGNLGFSLKFREDIGENPSLGNLGLARIRAIEKVSERLAENGLLEKVKDATIFDIFTNPDINLLELKQEILNIGFEGVHFWIFAHPDKSNRSIIYKIIDNDNLQQILLNPPPEWINKPRNSVNELRINHELINALPEETIIQFPLIDTAGYKEYERLTPTETRASELFGKRQARIDPDVLQYIRKNPRPFIKRLHKMYGDRFDLGLTF